MGKPQSGLGAVFRLVQLLPDSQGSENDSGDGHWNYGNGMDAETDDRSRIERRDALRERPPPGLSVSAEEGPPQGGPSRFRRS